MLTSSRYVVAVLAALLSFLAASCGERQLSKIEAQRWDAAVSRVTEIMRASGKPDEFIVEVKDAAKDANIVFPYLESVMKNESDEGKRSAALMIFTAASVLAYGGHERISDEASVYIEGIAGGLPVVTELLENQDRIPTYQNYPYTVDK